ncbi:class I SAM-dependent methyltransferase [Jatrophihabitans sp. YIM 134969]
MSDDLVHDTTPPGLDPDDGDGWYGQHKRDLTVAVLPSRRYHRAFEPGCGDGRLTALLATRCDEVVCWDSDPAAAAAAAARLADAGHVSVAQAALPHAWPDGTADLILISEVGCFLAPDELDQVMEHCAKTLVPGGVLVAVHRRTPTAIYPGGGDDVHARLFGLRGVLRTGGYSDQDLRIDVFERLAS